MQISILEIMSWTRHKINPHTCMLAVATNTLL